MAVLWSNCFFSVVKAEGPLLYTDGERVPHVPSDSN